MLFADRFEVWNPGAFPEALPIDKIKELHGSFPANPLIAEALYLTKYIERMGTGIHDMAQRCKEHNLPEPEISESSGVRLSIMRTNKNYMQIELRIESQIESKIETLEDRILSLLKKQPLSKSEIASQLKQQRTAGQLNNIIRKLLKESKIERTIPETPNSRLQKYRIK
jgi:predicted HTH transcriptional regulator